nr:hypothetical protein [Tanacetum cinerariifolium]
MVRIISSLASIVQLAKIRKQSDIHEGGDDSVLSTQKYIKKFFEDMGDIKNFIKNGKLKQVVAIIKSCTPNALGDLTMTIKDISGTILGEIHHIVINEGGYGKKITAGSALTLANVSIFSLKPSMHYLNITMKNVVKVFHKDLVFGNGSGVGGSEMFMKEEEIVKLMEEEEMAYLELQVYRNVIDQEDLYKFDEEALDLTGSVWRNVGKKKSWMRNIRDIYGDSTEQFKLHQFMFDNFMYYYHLVSLYLK